MKSFFIQIIVVVIIFNGVAALRESGMLSSWQKEQAPRFNLVGLNQQLHTLDSTDTKSVYYFFAPWCSVCRMSITNLQNRFENNTKVKVYAIALDYRDRNEVDVFARDLNLTFPILLGNEQVKAAYKISAYPSYYVVDDNKVVHRSMGYSTELGLILRSL
ncbi:TlpA family protein disulfide reductase [Thalassotalea aquiviva]|uniref:TlpA family protein disulfide reductase n=1 Tax=Thalassotalea aquiviva TaxID=3242415 RepID=UPI00352A1338